MRKLLATPLASAVLGGGVTAAVLLGAGLVEPGGRTVVVEQRPLTAGAAGAGAARRDALTPGEVYERAAPGVAYVRARRLEPPESPFEVGEPGESESTGSGFVLDEDGLMVTNAHVVDHATMVTVTLSGDEARPAEIVGTDDSTDLALLRVDPEGADLRPLELGSSAGVEVGDPTVAIGNPFGFDRTLTTGVVSAIQRRISAPDGYAIEDVIQTDAALNPGNSGGPLIDAAGRVIGVNSQIATGAAGAGSVGIGFAVPIDTVKDVVDELEREGRVERPWLGIEFVPVDEGLQRIGAGPPGLLVQHVRPGGPAARAGVVGGERQVPLPTGEPVLLGGDVVRSVGGVQTRSAADVSRALEGHEPGDTVEVRVHRDGAEEALEVTLGNRPAGGADS